MILPDVNVLVNAHRRDAVSHYQYRDWLIDLIRGDAAFGSSDLILSAFLRIVTNPRIYPDPTSMEDALTYTSQVRGRPNCVIISPGLRHWEIFTNLCRAARVRGNLVPDAYFAALAIESGSEWITDDGDYARFPGLRWRRPFD